MRYYFSRLLLITILGSIIVLSGCGSNKTASTTSSNQSTSSDNSSAQAQNQSPIDNSLPSASVSAPERMDVAWVDAKSDVLSPLDDNLDGIMDGHFHLTLQLPQPVMLESIFIRYSEFGKELRWDGIYNNHLSPAGYNLVVFENGILLPPGPDTGIKKSGQVELDLFTAGLNNTKGKDTFSFDPGSHFQIELNYTTQTGEFKKWSANITSQ